MKRMKLLPALLMAIFLMIGGGCTKKTCPTYATNDIPADTVADRFSNAEKAGAVLFVLFAVYASQNQ